MRSTECTELHQYIRMNSSTSRLDLCKCCTSLSALLNAKQECPIYQTTTSAQSSQRFWIFQPRFDSSTKHATCLPNSFQILEIIFSHLQFKDRMSASLVCRRWSGTAIPLRKVLLKIAGCWDRSVYGTFLASDRPYRHLEVHNIVSEIRYTSKLISKFRDSLETLEVESVYERNWMNALGGLPRLQELCLKCPLVVKSPAAWRAKRPCRSMRSLTIDEIDGSDFAFLNAFVSETFPGLTSLRLTDFVGDLRINGLPNLEMLEVVGTVRSTVVSVILSYD